jgi:hypothetical protein
MKKYWNRFKHWYPYYRGRKQLPRVKEAIKSYNHIVGEAISYYDFDGLKNINKKYLDESLFLLLIDGVIYESEPAHYRILE